MSYYKPGEPPKNEIVIRPGDVIQIIDKQIKEKKDGTHTMHFDVLAPGRVQYIRVMVENAEQMLNEKLVRVKYIAYAMQKGVPLRGTGGKYSKSNIVGVVLERAEGVKPNLIGELKNFDRWKYENQDKLKKPEAKPIEKPSYASEKVPKTAPIPSAKKITGQTTGFGLDSFLDALHDEDLSGVRECEDELPFN